MRLSLQDKAAYNRWLADLPQHVQHWQTRGPATRDIRSSTARSLLSSVGLRRSSSTTSRPRLELDEEPEVDVRPADPAQLLLEANASATPQSGGETSEDDADLALPEDDEPSPNFADIDAGEEGGGGAAAPILEAEVRGLECRDWMETGWRLSERMLQNEEEDTMQAEETAPPVAQDTSPLSNGGARQRADSQRASPWIDTSEPRRREESSPPEETTPPERTGSTTLKVLVSRTAVVGGGCLSPFGMCLAAGDWPWTVLDLSRHICQCARAHCQGLYRDRPVAAARCSHHACHTAARQDGDQAGCCSMRGTGSVVCRQPWRCVPVSTGLPSIVKHCQALSASFKCYLGLIRLLACQVGQGGQSTYACSSGSSPLRRLSRQVRPYPDMPCHVLSGLIMLCHVLSCLVVSCHVYFDLTCL